MRWLRALGSLAIFGAVALGPTGTAAAAAGGNSGLGSHIVKEPVPPWTELPAGNLDVLVRAVQQDLTVNGPGFTPTNVTVAADGWFRAIPQREVVYVLLVSTQIQLHAGDAVTVADQFCGISQSTDTPTDVVPDGTQETCINTNKAGTVYSTDAVAWVHDDVAAVVVGVDTPPSTVAALASDEAGHLPSSGGGFLLPAIGGTAGVVVLGLVIGRLTSSRRRSGMALTATQAGRESLGRSAFGPSGLPRTERPRPDWYRPVNPETPVRSPSLSGVAAPDPSQRIHGTPVRPAPPIPPAAPRQAVLRPPAWCPPTADGACPDGFPVKVKLRSGIFHEPGMAAYARTRPDRCYPSGAAAAADGYRRAQR